MASLLPSSPQNPADLAKKQWAMRLFTNHIIKSRWTASHLVSPASIRTVQIVEVQILSASAKVRGANIGTFDVGGLMRDITGAKEVESPDNPSGHDRVGMDQEVWTGVVPLYETLGEPVESTVKVSVYGNVVRRTGEGGGLNLTAKPRADEVLERWRAELNDRAKTHAVTAAQPGKNERDMREKVTRWEMENRLIEPSV